MKKKRLVPFWATPGSWGLTGHVYDEAEASYYLEGEELDLRLAEIRLKDNPKDLERKVLEIKRRYDRISEHEFQVGMAKLEHTDETKLNIALVQIDYDHGKISKNEFEKRSAALLRQPWIGIVDHGFDPAQGVNGVYFEFDWNVHWIEYLRYHGYDAPTEEMVVEKWFTDVCKAQTENDDDPVFPGGRFINRLSGSGGAEYS